MIKINLAKRRKVQAAAGGKGGLDLSKITLTDIFQKLKSSGGEGNKINLNSPVVKAALAVGALFLLNDSIEGYKADELKKVDDQIAVVEKEKNELQARLAKIKGFEPVKKQLEEDEVAIRTKLEVISRLLENRNDPAKVMMQIAQTIPEEVWLTELKFTEKRVNLAGATPGYNQVSDFIKALHGTSQFAEIGLSGIQENTSDKKDQRFQTFELDAERRVVQ